MMIANLPIELALYILRDSTQYLVTRHRVSAVSIALTSRAIHSLVASLLYDTVVLTRFNAHLFPPSSEFARVLQKVRRFYIAADLEDMGPAQAVAKQLVRCWIPDGRAFLDAPFSYIIIFLGSKTSKSLYSIKLSRMALPSAAMLSKSLGVGTHITHLIAKLPRSHDEAVTPEEWAQRMLEALPALRHVALTRVEVGQPVFRAELKPITHDLFARLRMFSTAPRAKLEHIVLRVSGALVPAFDRTALHAFLAELNDNRIIVWLDTQLPKHLPDVPKGEERMWTLSEQWEFVEAALESADAWERWDPWTPQDRPTMHGQVFACGRCRGV